MLKVPSTKFIGMVTFNDFLVPDSKNSKID